MTRLVPLRRGLSVFALILLISGIIASLRPAPTAHAASALEYTGWVPYWATAKGTSDAQAHLSQLTEVNPFGYSVKKDGTLNDTANMSDPAWQSLMRSARGQGVKAIPTVMWSDTQNIYTVLSNPSARAAHIQAIVSMVTQNGFDGVDIDYEGKTAETRPYFSAFLTELSTALYAANKDAKLGCTIEARMPLEARYSGTPPANIEYANDLPTINKVCDRVRLMTYDQQTGDVQLNAAHKTELYAPVADIVWVEKVVKYMSQDIDRSKILIGVATYGAEYQAMTDASGTGFSYVKTASFNPQYALDTAQQYGLTPSRSSSGELYISYVPREQSSQLPSQSTLSALAPSGTATSNLAALGALAYSKQQGKQAPVTYLTWSDAQAILDKARLAQRMGVAGIAIFKLDGSEDPNMWSMLATVSAPVRNPVTSRSILVQATSTSGTGNSGTGSGTAQGGTSNSGSTTTPTPTTTGTTGSTTTTASFTRNLSFGSSGADVKRLQTILIKKGYLKTAANGNFGPSTRAALKAWQKAKGLSASGFFGPQSRAAIVQ